MPCVYKHTLLSLIISIVSVSVTSYAQLPELQIKQHRTVSEGIVHTHWVGVHEPLSIHTVEVDVTHNDVTLKHANNSLCTRDTVSNIAEQSGAIIACNGGHYRRGGPFNGCSLGYLTCTTPWFSDPCLPHPLISWTDGGRSVFYDRIQSTYTINFGGDIFTIDRMNQPRSDHESVLYSPLFDGVGTKTNNHGCEVVINKKTQRVVAVVDNKGNSEFTSPDYFIYSCGNQSSHYNYVKKIQINTPVQFNAHFAFLDHLSVHTDSDFWRHEYALGAGPLLVSHGLIRRDGHAQMIGGLPLPTYGDEASVDFSVTQQREWFLDKRHPRTAVGQTATGSWVFAAVEGRDASLSVGLSCQELAIFMHDYAQCKHAINIGGGGCTTLYVDGEVVTHASGDSAGNSIGKERPVSEAFVVTARSSSFKRKRYYARKHQE